MAISVTALGNFSPGQNGGTSTNNFNTTGYDLIALIIASYTSGALTVSDSKSDATWTSFRSATTAGLDTANLYWAWDNTKRGTNHNFTVTGTSVYPGVIVCGIQGILLGSNPKDQSNTAIVEQGAGTTISATITPGFVNELVLSSLAGGASTNAGMTLGTADGFTKLTGYDFIGGTNLAGAVASRVDTSIVSATPVWSCTTSTVGLATCTVSFKAPVVGNVFRKPNLAGLGAGGPFFQDPLGAKSFTKRNHIYVPSRFVENRSSLSL